MVRIGCRTLSKPLPKPPRKSTYTREPYRICHFRYIPSFFTQQPGRQFQVGFVGGLVSRGFEFTEQGCAVLWSRPARRER